MSYENDEELRHIHEETARRKRELEELQREELRRIRELERGSGSGYSPELDSAFIQEPGQMQGMGRMQNLVSAQDPERIQNSDRTQDPGRIRNSDRTQDPGRLQNPGRTQRTEGLQDPINYQEPRRPKKRIFDPDQAVSDEEFINSFEDNDDEMDNERETGRGASRSQKREEEASRRQRREEEADRGRYSKKKKKKKGPGILIRIVAILMILFMIICLAIGNITRRFNSIDTEVSKRAGSMKRGIVNVLLIGQDARDGESGQRSDSMILISVNTKKNSVSMTSIMRDTYVNIPGYGNNRLNAAYAYGGIDLLDQTIEENFGITLDGNAMVDFDGFLESMTAVGNLDIELTAEEAAYMNANPGFGSNNDVSDEVWNLTAGVNSLTPSQLLAYSRIRYVGNSDWDRTQRQRNVISAAVSKVKHGHYISGYRMAYKAAPSITTDVKTWGMIRLAFGIMTGGEMKSHIVPVEGTYYTDTINGMAVLVPDLEKNKEYIQGYIDGEE